MEKNKLEGVVIYTNTTCPYCKNIKDLFEKENIENKMIEKVRRRNNLTVEIQGAVILTKQ